MFVTIINDCRDDNAMGRQVTRLASLMETHVPIFTLGVQNDLEAAGNLVDILDASEGRRGLVLANVAPRSGESRKRYKNGSPFGYFYYLETLVVASVDGWMLSLVKKLGILDDVKVVDLGETLTQFRSFNIVPKLGWDMMNGHEPKTEPYDLADVPDSIPAVWYVDCFGNCKTTILPEDVHFEPKKQIQLNFCNIPLTCYEHLKDVPDNHVGLIKGSSGIADKRFLEITVQGKNAAKHLRLDTTRCAREIY